MISKCLLVVCLVLVLGMSVTSGRANEPGAMIPYEVSFKGKIVATQMVYFARSEDRTTVEMGFEATLPVFVSTHHVRETLSVTYRRDGTVERFKASVADGGRWHDVAGEVDDAGALAITIAGVSGLTTNYVTRDAYDFNSLALYGNSPDAYLPTNRPARVLDISRGQVIPVDIQVIDESSTYERQYLITKHLIWTEGMHTSHSWHPEKFNDFPRRYLRQTGAGEFVFQLVR